MKKRILLLTTILLVFGLQCENVFAVCLPGDRGYPNCSNSSGGSSSGDSYATCKNECERIYTSSIDPGGVKKQNCLSSCESKNPNKPGTSEYCKQHPCLGSAADSGNPCCAQNGGGPANPNYTPKVTPKPTPSSGNSSKNENYYGDIGSEGYVCGGIMSDSLLQLIVKVYRTISLILVVAVVILGMMDFIKATSSDDADAMKKATKRFANRLIIVILIAILPTILSFILTLFGDENMKNCLDKINI